MRDSHSDRTDAAASEDQQRLQPGRSLPWHRPLIQAIEAARSSMPSASPGRWRSWMSSLTGQGLVGEDEIRWSYVMNWLADMPGHQRVSVDQLLQYLQENMVDVYDVVFEQTAPHGEAQYLRAQPSQSEWALAPPVASAAQGEGGTRLASNTRPGWLRYREVLITLRLGPNHPTTGHRYCSNIWQLPDVLAHMRLTDRLGEQGQAILVVEEIASEWAALLARAPVPIRGDAASTAHASAHAPDNWPEGPFVGSTATWLSLALKRLLALAAAEGYAAIALVDGEEVAARDPTVVAIARAIYEDAPSASAAIPARLDAPDGPGRLFGFDHNDRLVLEYRVEKVAQVDGLLGTAATQALLAAKPQSVRRMGRCVRQREATGLLVAMGGQRVRTFQDQMLPAVLKIILARLSPDHAQIQPMVVQGMPAALAGVAIAPDLARIVHQIGFTLVDSRASLAPSVHQRRNAAQAT